MNSTPPEDTQALLAQAEVKRAKEQKWLVNHLFPLKRQGFKNELEYFFGRIFFLNTECWLWRGGMDRSGYGTTKGRHPKAHRLAWELFNGSIPRGLKVLHKCDVRNCVNPEHLFLGTQEDNVRDMIAKGRFIPAPRLKGEDHPNSKLTKNQVLEMRALRLKGLPYSKLGPRFGISPQTAHGICIGRQWRHV